jgi:superfamily II DNA/RNA helicase
MSRLAEKIFALPSFARQFKYILQESARQNVPNLKAEDSKIMNHSYVDWNNLLECSSILAQSKKLEHLDAALRVAQQCILNGATKEQQKLAAIVILESLTNKLAIDLALKRQLITSDYQEQMPFLLRLEMLSRDIEHSIINEDGSISYLNKFQKTVYESYNDSDAVSISAPTSAGKSFILKKIILEELSSGTSKVVVFIVPTRALISQVEEDIGDLLIENQIPNVYLSSVPQAPDDELQNKHCIFIFTQERLHWFRSELPSFVINLIIIDEAHKISDGSRGILLQQKIEDVVKSFPQVKIFFSSPFTSNPEMFLEDIPTSKKRVPIKTEFISVNQNLIYLTQVKGKPMQWKAELQTVGGPLELGEVLVKNRPNSETKKMVFIACELADARGGNLIYVNGAADAEKYAQLLADALPKEYGQISEEVKHLIDLVQKVVHRKYSLASVLKKKVAFHYGNMPIIVRHEIERLFKQGDIHFIVCTSTLLEGVNLPAKSIFIRKPTRGAHNPLNDSDFWNLAGRAGRWGKEFSGNIICIEPHLWERPPLTDRTKQTVKRALNHVMDRKEEFLIFIQNRTPREIAKKNQDFEYAVTYFYTKFLSQELLEDSEFFSSLNLEFEILSRQISIPEDLIIKNIGISPIALQNLYNFFESYSGDLGDLIPVLPESRDAVDNYKEIVERINIYLSGDPEGLAIYQAILIVNWMRGIPLPVLIERSYNYWLTRREKSYSTVIREVMKDIEEFARFKFAKYSSCYVDLLRHFLLKQDRLDLLSSIPQLNIWLEFGVSQQTQISLIGLGLTRNSAITISDFIANDSFSRSQCVEWLRSQDLETMSISPIMTKEIEKILDRADIASSD